MRSLSWTRPGTCRRAQPARASPRSSPLLSRRNSWACGRASRLHDAPKRGILAIASVAAVHATSTHHAWPANTGSLVDVRQTERDTAYEINIRLSADPSMPPDARVELHWGVYRSDPSKWQHPMGIVPPDSYLDAASGGMRTRMQLQGGPSGGHGITLSVPRDLAPLTLAFVIYVSPPEHAQRAGAVGRYIAPVSGAHFAELIGMEPGVAEPLGVSLVPVGSGPAQPAGSFAVNFSVRSRGAEHVSLVILKPRPQGGGWGMLEVSLDPWANRTGDTWHVALSALRGLEGLCYGWRIEGDSAWETGNRFQPDKLMLDPHAPLLAYLPLEPPPPLPMPTIQLQNGGKVAVAGSLACLAAAQQGQQQQQGEEGAGSLLPGGRPIEQLRVLELDVRSFNTGKAVQHAGQYLGVAERVDHLRALGANAVLLAPAYATAPGIGPLGRAGVSFMAPDPQLSSNPSDPTVAQREFKAMVQQLHKQGIEVIMQVDFTFTADGTDTTPNALSFRGLDAAIYYRPNANGVLNCGHAVVQQFIVTALRHWALEYGVDGFCFLNADNLCTDRDGLVLDAPALADALAFDPFLSSVRLIAAPSDEKLLPRGGARGFPHWGLWLQRNNAFARDLLAFLLEGTSGMASVIATRLAGSPDVFAAQWDGRMPGNLEAGRRPAFGLNCVTSISGASLLELSKEAAAMSSKAAGGGAGGAGSFGVASGPPVATVVAKSLLLCLIMAQGLPVITQDLCADVELARLVGVLMRLRRKLLPLLAPPLFDSPRDVRWHGAAAGVEPDWDGAAAAAGAPAANYIAFSVRATDGKSVYLGINPHGGAVQAALPELTYGRSWVRLVDTGLEAPEDALLDGGVPLPPSAAGSTYRLAAKAAVLFVAEPAPAGATSRGYSAAVAAAAAAAAAAPSRGYPTGPGGAPPPPDRGF